MYINEAIRAKDFSRAVQLVTKYLRGKLGNKIYVYPTPEVFTSAGAKRVGIRYFITAGGTKQIRLNWKTLGKIGSQGLDSIDYWDGSKSPQPIPTQHYKFDTEQSLVKVLPMVVDIIRGEIGGKSGFYINEETSLVHIPMITDFTAVSRINEARYDSGEITKTLRLVIDALKSGLAKNDQYKVGGSKHYGAGWNKINDVILSAYPGILKKQGNKNVVDTDVASKIDVNIILASLQGDSEVIAFKATVGSKEEIEVEGTSETDIERLGYEEQLESLKTAMKLLMSNATNALFVQGRGGTGKTQNVEDELHAAGKSDGDGYVKITGQAQTAGIYRILFQHRKEILLFDDADGSFLDIDSRNLFKGASDTKKVRKISWQKGGKSYVDAADYDWDNEGDQDELPRSFEFTGKIIGISNLQLNKLDPDGALRTRGYIINVDPTNEEIYDFLKKICMKIPLDVDWKLDQKEREEVIDVLKARKISEKTANIRSFVRALNTRAGVEKSGGQSDEWKKFVLRFC